MADTESVCAARDGVNVNPLTLSGSRKVLSGIKTHPDQYNLLAVSRWQGSAVFARRISPSLDLHCTFEHSALDLEMALDGTRYLDWRDLFFQRWQLEIGWCTLRGLRVAAGLNRWDLHGDTPSYVDQFTKAVQLETGIQWRMTTHWVLEFDGQILYPFGSDRPRGPSGTPAPPHQGPAEPERKRDGLKMRAALEVAW